MKREAEVNADSDKAAREEIEKLNAADSLVFQTEKQLTEFGDKIPADKKEVIVNAKDELKKAHQDKNITALDAATDALNKAWEAASQDLYNAQQQQDQPGPTEGEPTTANAGQGNDTAQDVDFEEVK